MNKIKIRIKSKSEKIPLMVEPYQAESAWIGFGDIGNEKRKDLQRRRFLQIRNSFGLCSYFFWTEPRKGKEVSRVMRFQRVAKAYPKQIEIHFNK